MAFLDEDDAFEPEQPASRRRYGDGGGQRPFLARRLMALGVGVLIVILLVLGIRGCLNARQERGFENYVRDLVAINSEAGQLSEEFFTRLEDPGNATELEIEAAISTDRGTAESLLDRVEGLDTPGDLTGAQSELEKAFELRRDGIDGVSEEVSTALGNEGADQAAERIEQYMRYFLASDVLYDRARVAIDAELAEQDIVPDEPLQERNFLPDPVDSWLDGTNIGLTGAAGGGGDCPGVCGLALLNTEVLINGTALTPDALTTVSGGGPFEIEIPAQNQGDSEATDVPVEFSLSGGADTIEGDDTISRIAVGATQTSNLNIQPDPETGAELTLEVNVGPIPGEELTDNNTASYTVVFE